MRVSYGVAFLAACFVSDARAFSNAAPPGCLTPERMNVIIDDTYPRVTVHHLFHTAAINFLDALNRVLPQSRYAGDPVMVFINPDTTGALVGVFQDGCLANAVWVTIDSLDSARESVEPRTWNP
ncbi:MAG: hypothetical protein QOK29_1302 [Rhodospirillaceae bacterium]|nr:hypothetical protein [Rhodospirillaceae bacterium]